MRQNLVYVSISLALLLVVVLLLLSMTVNFKSLPRNVELSHPAAW
jgi:hypothetical protein